MLDRDGQPPQQFNAKRNLKKSMESLLGLCQGLLADNQLTEGEVIFLDTWLKENEHVIQEWPGDVIARRVQEVLADGVVTAEEAADLKDTLCQITGSSMEDGVASGMSASLPVEPVDAVMFEGKTFCFTGKFIFGSRSKCQIATQALGGGCTKDVTKAVDYLVIGGLASRDWANTSYGRKIQKAVHYRDGGHPLVIIDEESWAQFV